jgi:hypothetical protein
MQWTTSKEDQAELLACIGFNEATNFSEWCRAMRQQGIYPDDKGEWRACFSLVRYCESQKLLEVERDPTDNIESLQLTEEGAALVREFDDARRGRHDQNRPLLNL